MSDEFERAAGEAHRRREIFLATLVELRIRAAPAELAEDALSRLDPGLTWFTCLRQRLVRNKLLTLAVLAGAGWLAGRPRLHDDRTPATRKAGTASPRVKTKETNNDSGQHHQRSHGPGTGQRRKVTRAQGAAQAERNAGPVGEARSRTVGGEPEERPTGARLGRILAQRRPELDGAERR